MAATDALARCMRALGVPSQEIPADPDECAAQYLDLCRDVGHRVGEAHALTSLGELDLRQGCYQEAAGHLREALAIARDTGARPEEAAALGLLGDVVLAAGDHEQARAHYAGAFTLASQTGDTYWQARARDGTGRAYHAGADPEQARQHWQQALALYTEMGTPEAAQVADQLAGVAVADLWRLPPAAAGGYQQAGVRCAQGLASSS